MAGVTPSLPPYAHIDQEAVQCIAQASARYQVPELLVHAIARKEAGKRGTVSRLKDGRSDLGLTQINTIWLKELAKYNITAQSLAWDNCLNVMVSAYVLRLYYNQKQDWFNTIVSYNIGPNRWTSERYRIGYKYAVDVVNHWKTFQRWVDLYNPQAPSATQQLATFAPRTFHNSAAP